VVEESQGGGHRVVVPTVTIAKVGAYRGPLQMMLEVEAYLPNGDPLVVKCLVDTGAEANLIKKGLVPQHMTHAARKKLDLIAVNGQRLEGGTRTANLELAFNMQRGGKNIKEKALFNVMFWEAQIDCDCILAFPWFAENKIGIYPHLKARGVANPEWTLLLDKKKIR